MGVDFTRTRGSYILFLSTNNQTTQIISKLGELSFLPGIYLYIGSALGLGGLVKRIERHLKKSKKIFWHIDNLTSSDFFTITAYIEIYNYKKLECSIANLIRENFSEEEYIEYKGFGSSDCCCESHLHQIKKRFDEIVSILKSKLSQYDFKLTQVKD